MNASAPHYLLFSESTTKPLRKSEGSTEIVGHWRFVLERVDGAVRFEAADREPATDENRLQLLAVVRGLEALDEPSRVTLVTPSRYVTRGFRYGLPQWRDNDWCWERFGEMVPVKNRDLWQRIDRAMQYHHVDCRIWRFDFPETRVPKPRSAVVKKRRTKPQRARRKENKSPIWALPGQVLRTGMQLGLSCLLPLRKPCGIGGC